MTPKKQVSPAIRILRGERDVSARATHLEAATRKFLVTTNERKQMSTKTNFKRIALVAVAALGLGVLSSVPSNAAWSGTAGTSLTLTVVNGTAGLTGARSDSTTAGTFGVRGLALANNDSIGVSIINKTKPALAVDFPTPLFMLVDTGTSTAGLVAPVGKIPTVTSGQVVAGTLDRALTRYSDTATAVSLAAVSATGYVEGNFLVYLDSSTSTTRVAGTYTYTIVATPATGVGGTTAGTAQTIDISFVVTAAANTSETVDSSKSTAFLAGTLAAATADAAVSAVATASSTAAAYLSVRTYNAASGAAGESITVSIAGAGQLFHTNTSVGGTSITVKSAGGSDGDFQIRPDGRAGTATISVSTTSTTFSNKTVNFYAKAAKTITATVGTPLLAVGANTGAVRGVAVDANGTAWTGQAYIVASSATDALVGGSATTPVACAAYDTVNARHNCPITTLTTGTAKFKIIDAATVAAATATSNEVTVTVSAALPATVKLEFDKATYAPNERARIYVTPLDSTGKAMQSAAYTSMLASGGITVIGAVSYTGTTTTADSLTAATAFTTAAQTSSTTGAKAGSMQFTVYMPAAGGTVTLSATGGSALPLAGQVAVTATATVTDSGAAALAAVNALATTVASLKTLITTLTNLVLKIQKKVKA
jgi:trimeric autotransporter adhesin